MAHLMAHLTAVPNQARPRVLAADSSSMSTQLLVEALGRDSQFHMIEGPSNVPGILALVKAERPQIAVIGAQLEQNGGSSLIREMRVHAPETRVIVLLDSSERAGVTESFRAGAHGVFC